jgi:hypothetical protein
MPFYSNYAYLSGLPLFLFHLWLQKLIEDQRDGLESKGEDFEFVMKRERKSLSEEMKKE